MVIVKVQEIGTSIKPGTYGEANLNVPWDIQHNEKLVSHLLGMSEGAREQKNWYTLAKAQVSNRSVLCSLVGNPAEIS